MTVDMPIKEVENLNISGDDDNETVPRHETETLDGGEDVTLTTSDIADIVKKQLEDSNAQFCEMNADDIVGLFDEFVDKGVDISKFDYNIYTKDFYAERFPGFEPRFYECLEKASAEKFVNQSDKKDWRNYTYESGEFVLSFGGVPESKEEEVFSDCRTET
tara:strand:- start:180 stop:662 length:483 start_codon:yes stop_codon:yes gene_type:complete